MKDSTDYLLYAMLFLLVISQSLNNSGASLRRLEAKLDALQRRLNAIAEHLNVPLKKEVGPPGVLEQIQAGNKINAIKIYRQATGVRLKEAKDAVERIQAERMGTSGTIIQT
jgi:hypothetical protein